jgi:predicted Zn-dependent protease
MTAALWGMAGMTVSCGPTTKPSPTAPLAPEAPTVELPTVPAPIAVERVDPTAGHDPAARSPLLDILATEVERWFAALSTRPELPAFYLAYQIQEQRIASVSAEAGAILDADDETTRVLDVEVRVGSPALDNRRPLSNDNLAFLAGLQRLARVPFGADEKAIRSHLWLETDRRYREAVVELKRVMTNQSVTSDAGKRPPDFVHAPAEVYIAPEAGLLIDKDAWGERVRACSLAANRGVATRAVCRADFLVTTTYFVSSEGSKLQQSQTDARFTVSVGVKADDGMSLSRVDTRYARTPEELPDADEVEAMIAGVNRDLADLHKAPVVDPYNGPAILQGRAAAVFFHEVFGHRIEGHRQKDETSGRTFSASLGQRIMPSWLTVYDDPTLTTLNGIFLNGFYRFDDQGVRAERAALVTDGVLTGFVMGRNPIEGFPRSNGHGRHEPGLAAVSRQGNLVVEVSRSVPEAELKAMLIEQIRAQGKPYGMIFTDISGGFTQTSRFGPQSFKVEPIMAYRVFPDGREELVRGVDIEGTPLIALGSIIAAGRSIEVFNGICGAESGWVPVSASAPSLLLTQIEVARGQTGGGSSPTLPPPGGLAPVGGKGTTP